MQHRNHSIFRVEAVRRYIEGREESVLPKLVSPRIFTFLWILTVLLAISAIVAWLSRVPVYASGTATVAKWKGEAEDYAVVAFLPPDNISSIQPGQRAFLRQNTAGEQLSTFIIAVEDAIMSPDHVKKRFSFEITQPAVLAIAQFKPISSGLSPSDYVGSTFHIDIETGTCRVISLLPMIGQLLGG